MNYYLYFEDLFGKRRVVDKRLLLSNPVFWEKKK